MGSHKKIWKRRLLTTHRVWKLKQAWKKTPALKAIVLILLVFLITWALFTAMKDTPTPEIEVQKEIETKEIILEKEVFKERPRLKIEATNPVLVGRYGNNIAWYGEAIRTLDGKATINLDLYEEFGQIKLEIDNANLFPEEGAKLEGDFRFEFSKIEGFEDYMDNGILLNKQLFGDTGRGEDYLPKVTAFVSVWGTVNVFLEDQLLYSDLLGHFMVSEGIRRPDGTISKKGRVYQHQDSSDLSFVDPYDRELHFFIYSKEKDPNNFPQKEVFFNILFEDFDIIQKPDKLKI